MIKKIRYSVIMVLAIIIVALLLPLYSYGSVDIYENSPASFITRTFESNFNVTNRGDIEVEENLDLDYFNPSHGFYRFIPFRGSLDFVIDGKTYKSHQIAKITNIDVTDDLGAKIPYDLSIHDNNLVIKVGEENRLIKGEHSYKLKYTIKTMAMTYDNHQILYLNTLPTNWNSKVDFAKVNITLPKTVNKENFIFTKGAFGTGNRDDINWSFSEEGGKEYLSAEFNNLPANTGTTVFATLPENYFEANDIIKHLVIKISIIDVILCILIGLMWYLWGRDPKLVETVEFHPPYNLDPTTMGYLVSKGVSSKDLISSLVYMANKNYLAIEEIKEDEEDFRLSKVKSPSENEPEHIKLLFEALFETENSIVYSQLHWDFWEDFSYIKGVAGKYGKNLDRENYSKMGRFTLVAGIIINIINLSYFSFNTFFLFPGSVGSILSLTFGIMISIAFMVVSIILIVKKESISSKVYLGTSIFNWILGIGAIPLFTLASYFAFNSLAFGIVSASAQLIIVSFAKYGDSLTKKGADFYGRIYGFKNYIKTAELDRIKALAEENPYYFYEILPYAYVFGLEKVWMDKFKTIEVPNLNLSDGLSYLYLYRFLYVSNNIATDAITTMALNTAGSVLSSISSAGGSGGFTGGGYGGGGGSSW